MVSEKLGAAFVEVGADLGPLEKGLSSAQGMMQHAGTNITAGLKASLQGGNFTDVGKQLGNQLVTGMTSQFGMLGQAAGTFATALGPAGIALLGIAASIAVIGVGLGKCVSSAATWQDLMVDVQKVTTTTEAGFSKLSSDLLAIRGETGASMESIAGAAAGAGRMGIDPTEIAGYTEVILKMASAWGVSADASSDAIGKIGAAVKPAEMEWADFANRSGSLINDLADTTVTSEAAIIEGLSKLTGSMKDFKVQPDQLAGWASMVAYLQEMGDTSMGAGEHIKDALREITKTTHGEDIAALIGVDFGELQEMIRTDTIGTFEELAAAIADLPLEEQGDAFALFGDSGAEAMKKFAGGVDKTTGSISRLGEIAATGKSAWEDASSLNEQYAKSQETLNAQIDIFKGKISVAATSIGSVLLPHLTQMMQDINGITQALMDLGAKGWKWLYGGVDDEGAETKGAIGRLTGWMDEKLGIEYGARAGEGIGKNVGVGIGKGISGTGKVVTKELESADGKGAGEKVGNAYSDAFMEEFVKGSERAWEIGIDNLATATGMNTLVGTLDASGDRIMGRGKWKDAGYKAGTELGDGLVAGFESIVTGRAITDTYRIGIGSKEYSYGVNDLRSELTEKGILGDVRGDVYAVKKAIGQYAKDTGIILDIPLSVIYTWVGDPVAAAEQKKKELQGTVWDLFVEELAPTQAQIAEIQAAYESAFQEAMGEGIIIDWLTAWEDAGEEAAKVFADNLVSGMEAQDMVDRLEVLQLYDPAKFEEMGGEAALSWWQGLTDLLEQRAELKAVNIKADTSEIDNQIADAIKAGEPYLATIEANVDLNILGGPAILEGIFRQTASGLKEYTFADLLNMSPEERDLIIADTKSWGKNVLLPTIDSLIGEMNTAWDEGYTYNRTIVETALWDIIDAYHEFEGSFSKEQSKLISDLEAGTIGVEQFLDAWVKLGEGATESAKLLNGAAKTAEAACSECQEAMSEFGIWQEENADRLFSQSFIGPTDDYQKFLEQERARGAIHPEPIQLSMVYNAETAEADAALEELKESASETQYMPIEIDDAAAYSAIEKINAAASEPVIKPVYIQEYGGGNGSSMPTASASTVSWLNSICPSCTSSQGWGTSSWLPAFAEGGIVSRPIIARVGEVPEAITPLNVLFPAIQQAVAAAGGGGGVTINSTVIVQGGTVLDEDELQQVLNSRDDQLKNEIARKYLGR